jgi:sugar lactone lactonase YvrE
VMARDSHGEWEVCMPPGADIGQTQGPSSLSVDASDSLYVIDSRQRRLQRRDRHGRWTVLAEADTERDMLWTGVAPAPNGSIYVADGSDQAARLRMLDSKGRWTTVAERGHELGQINWVSSEGLATDSIGRLYVADYLNHRVQVRDVNGKWHELPAASSAEHSESSPWTPQFVAVDGRGGVYVAADGEVLRWTPQPQSKTATGASVKKK